LEYVAHIVDKEDLMGIPRIWRKTNPEVVRQEKIGSGRPLLETMIDVDAITKGRLKRMVKQIFHK
jgi:hypothetical protein